MQPVSTITFPTGGRDAQKKIFISSLHSKADGESCSSGPGKYNCSRDFSTGLLEDINEERKLAISHDLFTLYLMVFPPIRLFLFLLIFPRSASH
jgi:hypothetical protein